MLQNVSLVSLHGYPHLLEGRGTVVSDDALHAPAYGDLFPRNPDDGAHSLVRSSLDVDDRAVFHALFHAYLSWFVLTFIM